MSEIDLLIQELRDTIDNQREEIDRLNKLLDETRLSELHKEYIINELEKCIEEFIEQFIENRKSICWSEGDEDKMEILEIVLDKLKELKEENK